MTHLHEPKRSPDNSAEAVSSLHDSLLADLRHLLIEGELPAGERIPEAALCRRFKVSRTPLREALKVLAAEGFVKLRPNRGAIVAPLDTSEISPIFEVKGALERLIGLTIVDRISTAELAAIDEIHAQLRQATKVGDVSLYTQLNYTFHNQLAQATQNPVLIQSYDTLQHRVWRYRFITNEFFSRIEESFNEHEDIIVALHARTPLDLAARLEEHNRRTCESILRTTSLSLEEKHQSQNNIHRKVG